MKIDETENATKRNELAQTNAVIEHYDLLIEEGNDPARDSKILRDYMDRWDGQAFIDKLNLDKTKTALEIGVGTGRLAVKVAPLCGFFFGIDISPKTIERAKENLRTFKNASLICGDFMSHDFSQTFDVIYSSLTFMHVKEKQAALNKIARLLKNEGKFILSVDKNRKKIIDAGFTKIPIFPDNPKNVEIRIKKSGLKILERFETEEAHIFVAKK